MEFAKGGEYVLGHQVLSILCDFGTKMPRRLYAKSETCSSNEILFLLRDYSKLS